MIIIKKIRNTISKARLILRTIMDTLIYIENCSSTSDVPDIQMRLTDQSLCIDVSGKKFHLNITIF